MKGNEAIRVVVVLALLAAAPVTAQPLDAASSDALAATLRMLQDPALRGAAIAATPQAAAVDQQIQSIAGSPALTQEIYALAAQVMSELARSSGGDVNRMVEILFPFVRLLAARGLSFHVERLGSARVRRLLRYWRERRRHGR